MEQQDKKQKMVWFSIPKEAIKNKTDKAVLIAFGGPEIYSQTDIPLQYKCWLPFSKTTITPTGGNMMKVVLPLWMAEKSIVSQYVTLQSVD